MATDPTTKQVPAPCSGCLRETKHNVLHESGWQEEDRIITYAMLQCCGCSEICLAKQVLFTDDGSKEFEYYPPPVSRKRPKWLLSMIMNRKYAYIGALLGEIYEAAYGGQNRLAAMGIRALLENLMISTVGDHGRFDKNLDAFEAGGIISKIQKDTLASILEAGHGAMHRAFSPESNDIILALDIVEGVLAPLFHHHSAAEELSRKIPSRTPKKA
jgi:hypothetical protein